ALGSRLDLGSSASGAAKLRRGDSTRRGSRRIRFHRLIIVRNVSVQLVVAMRDLSVAIVPFLVHRGSRPESTSPSARSVRAGRLGKGRGRLLRKLTSRTIFPVETTGNALVRSR